GYQVLGGLAESLRAWMIGWANYGWVLTVPGPATNWTFDSSDFSQVDRRPTLTVKFQLPTNVVEPNPSYADLAGQPPSPLKLAWFAWADDLRQRRLDRVPNARAETFYFSQAGSDATGQGTL